jgi:hypothetical protein
MFCESPRAVTINLADEIYPSRANALHQQDSTAEKPERQRSQRKRWDIPSNVKIRQNSLSESNFNSNQKMDE